MPPRVVIAQRRLTHYRVPLFEALRRELAGKGIELTLVHGQPAPMELAKQDSGTLPWAVTVSNRYWQMGGKDLVWQPLPLEAAHADLVVVTQENSILSNYPLLLRRRLGGPKVAFWGHGANLQSQQASGLRERWKRWWMTEVDWWFAYTGMSVDLVASSGFPRNRITNLENAVDTTALGAGIHGLTTDELARLRTELGLDGARVGLFMGSLYANKRIAFLLEAATLLHDRNPAFKLLIVGDGPLRDEVSRFCSAHPWCAWVGAKTGRDKVKYLALADVMLNPGAVGLALLDAFAAGVPMVTADCRQHGPEIAYLSQDSNGLMTADTLQDYADGVHRVLDNPEYRARLGAGCVDAATHYTIENMAKNFSTGIKHVLNN